MSWYKSFYLNWKKMDFTLSNYCSLWFSFHFLNVFCNLALDFRRYSRLLNMAFRCYIYYDILIFKFSRYGNHGFNKIQTIWDEKVGISDGPAKSRRSWGSSRMVSVIIVFTITFSKRSGPRNRIGCWSIKDDLNWWIGIEPKWVRWIVEYEIMKEPFLMDSNESNFSVGLVFITLLWVWVKSGIEIDQNISI